MNINKYVSLIEQYVQRHDAFLLSQEFELRVNSPSSSSHGLEIMTNQSASLSQALDQSRILSSEPLIKKYILSSLWSIHYFQHNDIENSYLNQAEAFSFILDYLGDRNEQTGWSLDIFCKSAESFRSISNYVRRIVHDIWKNYFFILIFLSIHLF